MHFLITWKEGISVVIKNIVSQIGTPSPTEKIMKTLLLIRHAKSSWEDFSVPDFERPLNERGKNDAPRMARKIKDRSIKIDAFVSSPAKRAKKTAELFMKVFKEKEKNLIVIPSLYEAPIKTFFDVVYSLDDKFDTVAVFAHNPGITGFVNSLGCETVDNMPTCAIYAFSIKTKKWKDFGNSDKKFLFFDFPKKED
jgi:phosphohistidine phosphatase